MARAAKGEGTLFKNGDRGWRGYITVNGKRKYFSAPTKAEAARKRRTLINQRDMGTLSTSKAPTVEKWLTRWYKLTESNRALSTNAGYRSYMERYILPGIGKIPLDKLTIDDLESFYKDMEDRGLSGSTRHQCHSIIRVALKHAVWRGHIARNVATLVQPPSPDKKRVESLSESDLAVLYKTLADDRFRARWHLSLDFGLRPGEAIALEWKHVDFDAKTILIEQQTIQIRGEGAVLVPSTKTNSGTRVIALPGYMMDMLKETREQQLRDMAVYGDDWAKWEPDGEPHAFCFTRADGSVLRPGYDSKLWKKLLERAGLPHNKRYVARHTAASMAISHGADIPAVAEMMGHSNPAVTLSVYTHPVEERKRALADQAAMRFELASLTEAVAE